MALTNQIHIPPQSGTAFTLETGQTIRVIDVEGEQVSDFCLAQHDLKERLSSGCSIDYNNKLHLSTGDLLYSNQSSPMMTITADQVGRHDFLFAPCSQEMFEISYGVEEPHPNCLDNLSTNLAPFNVEPHQITIPFNIFMNSSIGDKGEINIHPPRSKAGEYIELRAEMALVVGVTACAAGKCNNFHCSPIMVEIFGLND